MSNLTPEQKKKKAEYARSWRKANPEKVALVSKRSNEKNKEKRSSYKKNWANKNKEALSLAGKTYYAREKLNIKHKNILKRFGLTLDQYNEMFSCQNGVCAICGGGPDAEGKCLAIDHCHETGKIRALLCRGCNVGIGNLKDSPDLLIKAAEYLKLHKKGDNI